MASNSNNKPRGQGHRHRHRGGGQQRVANAHRQLVLVGNPNVGKSVIFNALTGAYVTVSNYPGTTVEVSHGHLNLGDVVFDVIDTPGMYGFIPITEEERVTRSLLLTERPDVVLHVVDAKNLDRMLPLTLQLQEAGLPLILVVNMLDEAEGTGLSIDLASLGQKLGIPVVGTKATQNQGLDQLRQIIHDFYVSRQKHSPIEYNYFDDNTQSAVGRISSLLTQDYKISRETIALLLLAGDDEITQIVSGTEESYPEIAQIVEANKGKYSQPLNFIQTMQRQVAVSELLEDVVTQKQKAHSSWADWLNKATINPWTGVPLLLLVIYYGLYQFVGVFGAGTLVDYIETNIFEAYINPWVNGAVEAIIPWPIIQDLFAREYGIITLGVRYAVAIVLPIVGTFFLAFSVIEDSGYLPRIALLLDRVFKRIGLNGRAVIPMTLGFGCGTMATMVTRTLETKRERILATILLALAIPCSAQLGVILALLSGSPKALLLWGAIVLATLLLVGYISAKILPGEQPGFCLEVPPLRMPKLSNVLAKTYTRMQWYFVEVLPLFVLASVIIWVANLFKLFDKALAALNPIVNALGLPNEASFAFLFGFFRRDYGAAGLYDLQQAGFLSGNQILVAAVTLTLFVPCIAQFAMMWKERGPKTAIAIAGFIVPFAFAAGYLLNTVLNLLGVVL